MFDPFSIDNPLIMNKCCESKVDVIVDPILSKSLRTHQRQGIKFLYDCVMNLVNQTGEESLLLKTDEDIKGCLLADEMGLGKTLMTITLIWTLLKQTPYPTTINQRGMALTGTISKVLIVCPVTLITNWKKEFKKWLPMNKIGVLTLNNKNTPVGDKAQVKNFLKVPRTYQAVSYTHLDVYKRQAIYRHHRTLSKPTFWIVFLNFWVNRCKCRYYCQ